MVRASLDARFAAWQDQQPRTRIRIGPSRRAGMSCDPCAISLNLPDRRSPGMRRGPDAAQQRPVIPVTSCIWPRAAASLPVTIRSHRLTVGDIQHRRTTMSRFTARRRATAIIGAAAAATAITAGTAAAYASTTPHKHPVVAPHVPRSLISKALPSAISPASRRPGMIDSQRITRRRTRRRRPRPLVLRQLPRVRQLLRHLPQRQLAVRQPLHLPRRRPGLSSRQQLRIRLEPRPAHHGHRLHRVQLHRLLRHHSPEHLRKPHPHIPGQRGIGLLGRFSQLAGSRPRRR